MSDPTRPHNLVREIERGAGGTYVAARYAQMRCDGGIGLCRLPPARAPRLVVPAGPWPGSLVTQPLKMWTTLHYCERHRPDCTIGELLTPAVKTTLERLAKAKWPQEFRPDFEAATIEWMLVTTPEYERFLLKLERSQGLAVSRQGVPVL